MTLRLSVQDTVVYESEAVPVEAVTWQFSDTGDVQVALVVGDRPYTY